MHKKMKKLVSGVLSVAMLLGAMSATAFAAGSVTDNDVDATLSCYVSAMGGVEFSDGYGLLQSISVTKATDGTYTATLNLGQTSGLSIYGVSCTAFIGNDEAPGYYKDGAVTTEGVTYNVASTTATGPSSSTVNWIDSITMPVEYGTSTYTMWLYLNSNVMGCQLGDGSGTGASNTPGVATKHTATLTIDWDSVDCSSSDSGSTDTGSGEGAGTTTGTTQTSNVTYTVEAAGEDNGSTEGTYEVEIPETITVDQKYEVKLTSITGDGYVTVSADKSGTLSNGSETVTFYNTFVQPLTLKQVGDSGSYKLYVKEVPPAGTYNGTLNFVINYVAG